MSQDLETIVRNPAELGRLVRAARKRQGLDQRTAAGLAGVGTRFLNELEGGKATARLGLALQVLSRLGLELSIRPRGGAP